MKKILMSLLVFMIVLVGFRIITNNPKEEVNKPVNTANETGQTENTTIPSFEPVIEKEEAYAPIEPDNTTGFQTSWYILNLDGNMEASATYDTQTLTVHHGGTAFNSNQLFRENAAFINGYKYEITFNASSNMDRDIELVIMNMDTSEVLASQIYSVTSEKQSYSLSFNMNSATSWNTRVEFNLGLPNSAVEHVVEISNIYVLNKTVEDQNVKVNQIGYDVYNQKRFVIPYNQGDLFKVINADTNEVVYEGALVNQTTNSMTNETNYYGDFTNVMTPGRYYIQTQMGGTSPIFSIGQHLYKTVANDVLRFFSIQRCGQELSSDVFGELAHGICHNAEHIVYDQIDITDKTVDASGGWHDAGDYGRYVQTGAKALFDLMFAYMANPDSFTDEMGIAESSNGIPDVLDEARYELEWFMKMQGENGEVYSKAVSQNFALDISPDEDNQPLYVLTPETTAAGDFVAALAMASVIYQDFDEEFANECLDKAKITWDYLKEQDYLVAELNPGDINAGLYRDDKDKDERFFAGIAMWVATSDNAYLESAINMLDQDATAANGLSYTNVGAYGAYYYLIQENAQDNKELYDKLLNSLITEADVATNNAAIDGYNTSIINYGWGSNGDIVNNGILMMFAYDITGEEKYQQTAVEQLNYIFGKNSLNMTFVTGYGLNSPTQPHSRLAKAKNTQLVGALIGGANSNREDTVSSQIGWDVPPAKVYADDYLCYSTNEVSIYWNGALINLMAQLDLF